MGAVKAALSETIDSAFVSPTIELYGDQVVIGCEMFDYFIAITSGDDDFLRSLEQSHFANLHVDTADFLTDWLGAFTSAYAVLSGLATTEDGCVGNYLDLLAFQYHHAPRHVGRALQRIGFTDAVAQGIIYLLAGRLLNATNKLGIVSFDYLDKR